MQKNGYIPIEFPRHNQFSLIAKLHRCIYFFKTLINIKPGATVIFLFPVYAKLQRLLLRFLRFKKNIRLICFVADIDGIKDGDKNLLAEEIKQLKHYRYFIAHNEAMKLWLQNNVAAKKISTIEFFDFLTPAFGGDRQKSKRIVFAGNLKKSSFLEELHLLKSKSPDLVFVLYGPDCTDKMRLQDNVSYKGIAGPYELPAVVDGSFGLVWDGNSIEGPVGNLGGYMGYISHHKLSLYILSGLPVIVPEMAGSASLVRKYKIGITICNLYEIDAAIETISDEDYGQMRKNMKDLAEKISSGKQLATAIEELISADER